MPTPLHLFSLPVPPSAHPSLLLSCGCRIINLALWGGCADRTLCYCVSCHLQETRASPCCRDKAPLDDERWQTLNLFLLSFCSSVSKYVPISLFHCMAQKHKLHATSKMRCPTLTQNPTPTQLCISCMPKKWPSFSFYGGIAALSLLLLSSEIIK